MKERIATIIKVNNHSSSSFAQLVGVQRSSLSHILNGRNNPSVDFIQKVLEHFPNVDANWLITGKEPSRKSQKTMAPVTKAKDNADNPVVKEELKHDSKKDIKRIVVFYTDNTFDQYEQR